MQLAPAGIVSIKAQAHPAPGMSTGLTSRNCKRYFATAPSGMHPLGSVCSGLLPCIEILNGLWRRPLARHLGSTSSSSPSAPPAATDRPRLFPRAQGRGAARLSLGLDRRLRMGEGSASVVPWGDGFGKGDWAGWRGTTPTARAAPVVVGMIFSTAARLRRKSICEMSARRWSLV